MKILLKVICLLLLACSVSERVFAQVVKNPSFEQNAPVNTYSFGPIPGWQIAGSAGVWQPGAQFFSSLPDGATITFSNGGTISQDLGAPATPNTIYTLTVFVGHRQDSLQSTYVISLTAGLISICSQTGQNGLIPLGTFVPIALTCPVGATPPVGNMVVSLASAGVQVDFDNVTLTSASSLPPPPPVSFALSGSLLWDDATPIQGDVQVQQQSGVNSFQVLTDLIPDATGAVSGTVSVDTSQPDPVTFKFILLDLNGVPVAFMQQAVPKIMFQTVHGVNNFKIVVSKANLTLAAGTDPGILTQ